MTRERFNSNNHWEAGPPVDYRAVLDSNATAGWIDKFHVSYHKAVLPPFHVSWILRAWLIGRQTGTFPRQFQEDLDDLRLDPLPQGDWFVRGDHVSLKSGMHGAGPYRSWAEIIQSLVTTCDGHSPLARLTSGDSLHLYLLPWICIDADREFRVFVCDGRVTCVSQQNIYAENKLLAGQDNAALTQIVTGWVYTLSNFYYGEVAKRLAPKRHFTLDIALLGDGSPYFIEPNSFGKEYAAGSALFHWIHDDAIIHGDGKVHCRFALHK